MMQCEPSLLPHPRSAVADFHLGTVQVIGVNCSHCRVCGPSMRWCMLCDTVCFYARNCGHKVMPMVSSNSICGFSVNMERLYISPWTLINKHFCPNNCCLLDVLTAPFAVNSGDYRESKCHEGNAIPHSYCCLSLLSPQHFPAEMKKCTPKQINEWQIMHPVAFIKFAWFLI